MKISKEEYRKAKALTEAYEFEQEKRRLEELDHSILSVERAREFQAFLKSIGADAFEKQIIDYLKTDLFVFSATLDRCYSCGDVGDPFLEGALDVNSNFYCYSCWHKF